MAIWTKFGWDFATCFELKVETSLDDLWLWNLFMQILLQIWSHKSSVIQLIIFNK